VKPRHFLTLMDLSAKEIKRLLARAIKLKAMQRRGKKHMSLAGKTMAMIFEKSSTRTRVSFQVGMAQLGGTSLFLSPRDTHLDRGEPVEDTARVLSRMVDVIVIRQLHAVERRALAGAVVNASPISAIPASCCGYPDLSKTHIAAKPLPDRRRK
jgi:ornithine carbamoyltransferase